MIAGILVVMIPPSATPRPPLVHHDVRTGRAVFVAPGRDERPTDAELAAASGAADAARWCPFCAGNESLTPPDVLRAPAATAAGWQARIIPNRYPVVAQAAAAPGPGPAHPAHGVHEVVIESPRHDTLVTAVDPAGWRAAWKWGSRAAGTIPTSPATSTTTRPSPAASARSRAKGSAS